MSLLLVGVNHKACPIRLRERLAALEPAEASRALSEEGFREAVVVSTCNRFEVYTTAREGGPSLPRALDRLAGAPVSEYAYKMVRKDAARHLFEVASGLDSLVLGETEILGQVRNAYLAALATGATAKVTNVLFQRALFIGKSVRNLTAISMGQLSTASVAVELARRIFGDLAGSKVLILGAGEMAEKTARYLLDAKVDRLSLANRTWEKATALAPRYRADPVRWEDFPEVLRTADVLISSTASPEVVVDSDTVRKAVSGRSGRSLFIIDIAMPRDVADDVHELDNVYLYRLEDFQAIVAENISRRAGELENARVIVEREGEHFGDWLDSLGSGRELSLRHSHLRGRGPAECRSWMPE